MKKAIGASIFALIIALFIAIAMAGGSMPGADAKELWNYITENNPYQKWDFWPGHDGMYPGKSPHGAFLKLRANKAAIKAAQNGQPMPEGAILVKENYGKDRKTLMSVTPMYKIKGYNPDGGDWFWAKFGANGSVMTAGQPEGCINCHRLQQDNDWLYTKAK